MHERGEGDDTNQTEREERLQEGWNRLLSLLNTSTIFSLLEYERFSERTKPNVLDIVADSSVIVSGSAEWRRRAWRRGEDRDVLEVRSGIVGTSDEDAVSRSGWSGRVNRSNVNESAGYQANEQSAQGRGWPDEWRQPTSREWDQGVSIQVRVQLLGCWSRRRWKPLRCKHPWRRRCELKKPRRCRCLYAFESSWSVNTGS